MKLLRYGPKGQEKPGVLDEDGIVRDLSGMIDDITGDTFTGGDLERLDAMDFEDLPEVEGNPRIGPCIGNVGKFICIGLNYSDHAAEAGQTPPAEPIVFMKATTAITGPDDDVEIPRTSQKTDWEVELGFVIGKRAKYVGVAEALDYVAGYCTVNDVSERSFQSERSGQWTKGKSHDTFGPIGPWLVTADEVPDPQVLDLWLDVDGERKQTGNTSTMIFDVATIISHLSQFMTLEPGDVVSTGTPPGVGMGHKPEPVYLKAGQTVTLGVDGLGTQTQKMVQA
ncbi:MAG: fumarylacetoacetate hydrolase family protein [Sneathiella sp.]|uniref:fumarylacetoacetate hydrolase family protein n=1 Tax=Sneathiella sp. TaxID=1964365 RepID=UPI0030015E90